MISGNSIDSIIRKQHRGQLGAPIVSISKSKRTVKDSCRKKSSPQQRKLAYGIVLFNAVALITVAMFLITGRKPSVLGAEEATFTMPGTGDLMANFDDAGFDNWSGTTQVSTTEVKLGLTTDWWSEDYDYQRQLTIKNLSADELAAGSTAQVTVNTKELFDTGKAKDNCQDIRIVWKNPGDNSLTQLTRSFYGSTPGGNCSVSYATVFSFPLKAAIAASGSDGNYYLYYGNPSATEPGHGDDGYSNPETGANATLVCPFNGSTTCVDGETPSTATGAIRYSGNKSAMSFDGRDDKITGTTAQTVNNITAEVWIYSSSQQQAGMDPQIIGVGAGLGYMFELFNNNLINVYIRTANNAWGIKISSSIAITHNTWHHVAITYTSGMLNLFIDGINRGSNATITGNVTYGPNPEYVIGNWSTSGYYRGLIDEVRISDTIRYTGNFTPQTTPFVTDTNTDLLLHFDENGNDPRNSGKTIDSSGNGNHGTITGAKYVSGLVGVDSPTAETGYSPTQPYAGHTGVFVEEGTTNKVTNPSFDNATFNTNWAFPYSNNYDPANDTFTGKMVKRNSTGPFAAGPIAQGKWSSPVASDAITYSQTAQIAGSFYNIYDPYRGTVVLWVTPEWNGNDGKDHILWSGQYATQGLYKLSSNQLVLGRPNYTSWVGVDISSWTAGTTYLVIARWDNLNKLNGTNYASITINSTTTFGYTSSPEIWGSSAGFVGRSFENNNERPANALIEGLTVYRRPLYEASTPSGVNVGNGDEIAQIYNGSIANSKDPTLITGSWDVVFALPTNAATGEITSGTGNAWTHPHSSNVLYTSTTNTGGFMMNGTYTSDGWTNQGTPTSVGALASTEKVFPGGYKWTNDSANEGIKYTKSSLTAGQNYVVRALAHSDGTSIPKIQIWDATNGAEITQMTGANTSTRTAPNVFLFTFELPTVARNGVAADCTSIEVRLLNTQSSNIVYWHQVELLTNLIDNPSLETGTGDVGGSPNPWVPNGWSNYGLDDGEGVRESSSYHSGSFAFKGNLTDVVEGLQFSFNQTNGAFASFGLWQYGNNTGRVTSGNMVKQASNSAIWDTLTGADYSNKKYATRYTNTSSNIRTEGWAADQTFYIDDVYLFNLPDVSLTVTPSSEANSLETTGLRVDGLDTLSQPLTGITDSSGTIKFRITPRHSWSTAASFGVANPVIAVLYGDGDDYIKIKYVDATTLRVESYFNNTSVNADWANPTLNAGTGYSFELSYTAGGNLSLKVSGTEVAVASGVVAFSTTPTIIYYGSDDTGANQYDCTVNMYAIVPSETTTMPYYRFGSKSALLANAGSVNDEYVTSINAGNTNNHTLSAYVFNGTTGAIGGTVDATVAKLVFNGTAQTTTYTDMGGGWWRLAYTAAAGSGAQNYGIQVLVGKTVYADGVQLEEKAYATTYADGSLGTGYAWSGTAHNSTSIRDNTKLTYSKTGAIDITKGTVSLWVRSVELKPSVNDSGWCKIWGMGDPGSSYLGNMLIRNRYWYGHSNVFTSGTSKTSVNGINIKDTRWHHLVATWDIPNNSASFFIDYVNSGLGQANYNGYYDMDIGYRSPISTGGYCNIIASDLRIYNTVLSSEGVADLYYQGLQTHQNSEDSDSKYQATGTYTTPVLDLGPNSSWSATDDFTTTQALNGGTLSYQTSTSANGTDWDAWQDLSGAEIQSTPRRYLKVKASLAPPGDQTATPQLQGLNINYIPDATPPTNPTSLVTSPGDPANWYNDSTPTFSWPRAEQEGGASDPGEGSSGVKQYHVYFGTDDTAIPYLTVTNKWIVDDPDSGDVEFTLPEELTEKGTYYLRIQAEDNAGNYQGNDPSDAWAAFEYQYEEVNPTRPIYVGANPSGYTRTNDYTFSWPAGTDADSGVWGYCYKAGDGEEACETKESLLVGDHYEKHLVDIAYQNGENVFYVRTKDNAGNYSSYTQATFYFNSDAPTPPVSVEAHQDTGCPGGDDNCWYFSWSPPLEYTEEIVKYYYSINETPTSASPYVDGDTLETESFAAGTRQGSNTFYVVAEDVVGVSFGDYGSATFNVDTTAPGIPTSMAITDASNRDEEDWALTVKWSEPSAVGSGIDHYNVYKSENGTDYSKIAETSATGYLDTGLNNTTEYFYKATASDNAGAESGLSAAVSATPTGKYTSAPLFGGTPVATTTAHTAVIAWTTDRLAEEFVEYGTTDSYELGRVGDNELTTAHRVTLRGLSSETQFHYRVQSLDDGAVRNYDPSTAYSEDYTFSTLKAPDITEVTASDITLSSATISWKTTTISTSEVHYGPTMAYGGLVSEQSSSLTTNHTLRLTGLNPGTMYHFKIIGMDADDVEITSEDNVFSTIAYPRISNLSYEKGELDGEYGMNLSWETNVPASSIARYYPQDDSGNVEDETKADLETTHSMFISGLLDNTTYLLQVQGRDAYGNLATSETVQFTTDIDTRPPIISNLIVETASQGSGKDAKAQIIVSWETNEPSTSQVEYGAGVGGENYTSKSPQDSSLNKTHVVVLSDLDSGTPYSVRVLSDDAVGNTATSGNYTIVTSMPTESALDLILGTLRDNFGWLFEF